MLSFVTSLAFISDHTNAVSLLGSMAVVTVLVWPLFSDRRMILLIQCIGTSAFALHFLLIGSKTAAVTSCIALVQLLAAAVVRSRLQLWLIYGASGIVLVCATVATWNGLPSILASIGSLLAMVARLQQSTSLMKAGFLISAPFWAMHNFIVGSVFGLTVDVVSTSSIIAALCRTGLRSSARSKLPIVQRSIELKGLGASSLSYESSHQPSSR